MTAQEIYDHYSLVLKPYDRMVKDLRELNRRTGEQDWPDCCYFPFRRWVKLLDKDFEKDSQDLKELMATWFSALVTWKQSQIVWTVEGPACSAIHDETYDTQPITFLFDLPRWGVYVDFKDTKSEFWHPLFEKEPIGAFITLDYIAKHSVAKVIFVREGTAVDEAQYMPYPLFMVLDEKIHVGDKDKQFPVSGLQEVVLKLKRVLAWHYFNGLGKVRGVVS